MQGIKNVEPVVVLRARDFVLVVCKYIALASTPAILNVDLFLACYGIFHSVPSDLITLFQHCQLVGMRDPQDITICIVIGNCRCRCSYIALVQLVAVVCSSVMTLFSNQCCDVIVFSLFVLYALICYHVIYLCKCVISPVFLSIEKWNFM